MMAGALLYNVKDAARLQKIRFALFKLGISGRTVAPEELSHPVGYLCGLDGFSPAEAPAAGSFSDEMLVLYGLLPCAAAVCSFRSRLSSRRTTPRGARSSCTTSFSESTRQ